MSLELYQCLRLSQDDQSVAAAVWRLWVLRRRELSQRLQQALEGLSAVISTDDVPMHELQMLHSAPHTSGDGVMLELRGPRRPAARVCRARAADCSNAGAEALHACGCECACAGCERGTPWQLRLLGARGANPAAAAAAQLQRVHADDASMLADMMRAVALPGALFSTRHLVAQLPVSLKFGLPMVDWLQLCRSAARELEHDALLQVFV